MHLNSICAHQVKCCQCIFPVTYGLPTQALHHIEGQCDPKQEKENQQMPIRLILCIVIEK